MLFGCVDFTLSRGIDSFLYEFSFVQLKINNEFGFKRRFKYLTTSKIIPPFDSYLDEINKLLEQSEIQTLEDIDDNFMTLLKLTIFKDF